ncbi:MAG: hypothetical protein ACR2IT_01380 [Pirellulales bacterium]
MTPSTPHALWSLSDAVATQRAVGPHVALELHLQRPADGLTTLTNDHRDHLLGVGVANSASAAGESEGPLTDHWLRGSDLTAIYEPADPRQLRATAMWRIREAQPDVACWEAVVSAQTSLLESDASLAVISDVEADELLWSAPHESSPHWQSVAPHTPLPEEATSLLIRRGSVNGAATSVLIAGHPADRRRIALQRSGGRVRIECWLFPSVVEKGVLLRSRVLAAIGPRLADETWAGQAATTFAASPPPLTT